jgi:hypothetical protein
MMRSINNDSMYGRLDYNIYLPIQLETDDIDYVDLKTAKKAFKKAGIFEINSQNSSQIKLQKQPVLARSRGMGQYTNISSTLPWFVSPPNLSESISNVKNSNNIEQSTKSIRMQEIQQYQSDIASKMMNVS